MYSKEDIKKRRQATFQNKAKELKEDFFGEAPAPFIGRFGYPDINVGILSSQFKAKGKIEFDNPKYWAKNNYQIKNVLDLRGELVHSRFQANVKAVSPLKEKLVDITKEVGLVKSPAEVEIN